MRMGAERIVKCLAGILNGYGLPDVMPWAAAAARLGACRGRVDAVEPPEDLLGSSAPVADRTQEQPAPQVTTQQAVPP